MRFPRYRSRVWAAAVFVAAASLTAAAFDAPSAAALSAQATAGGVEDDGADCVVPNPTTTNNSKLPDPFTKIDGTRVTTKSDWRCRREEIKKMAESYVYGEKHGKPSSVTGTVSNTNITVNVSDQGRTASFSASVQLPSGSGPFPAVVVLGGLGADTSTILSSGAAIINYDPLAVGKEGTPRNNKQGAYYTIYGSSSTTGLLAAWAWGVSRIIDVVEQSGGNILKADAMGVTGCSRYGKGAFAVGAFDQRIALTMPIESGTAGVPSYRGIAGESGSQPLSSAYSEQPWFGDAFSSFTGNPNSLPIDTHEIVGMIAPRGLFIMENPHVDWLGAKSGSVAALGGAEIYKALGAGSNISYWSDVQDGTHCAVRSEWKAPLQQSIQKFLRGTGTAPSVFRISSLKSGNLADWRTWTTPTLTDNGGDPSDTTPPSVPSGLKVTGTTSSSVSLSWPAATDNTAVTGYDVFRNGTLVGSPAGTTYTDTGLAAETDYTYTVRARDGAGNVSAASDSVTGTTTAGGDTGGNGCAAAYKVDNDWGSGFTSTVTVSNPGTSPINGWTVTWTWSGNQKVTSAWNATVSQPAQAVTATNVAFNGTVAPGSSTSFGFQATYTGSNVAPTLTCTAS